MVGEGHLTFEIVIQRLFDDASNFGEFLVLGPTANGKLGKKEFDISSNSLFLF